jgi:hypothetical protein
LFGTRDYTRRNTTMATKKAATTKQSAPKTQARTQDSAKLEFSAEAVTFPTDEANESLERERAELHKPGRASKADAEQIDNDPGYNRDQLAHMREYWGLKPDESTVEAEAGQEVEVLQ